MHTEREPHKKIDAETKGEAGTETATEIETVTIFFKALADLFMHSF